MTGLRVTSGAAAVFGVLLTLVSGQAMAKPKPAAPAKTKAASPTAASAQSACVAAYKSAIEREQAGQLREAKQLMVSCARTVCTPFLRQECRNRFTQLESDIPTIIPLVTDASGAPRSDVEVTMDGQPLLSEIDGRALAVDPGLHEFSFSTAKGGVFATERVMVLQGQRNRPVSASLRGGGGGGGKVRKPARGPQAMAQASAEDEQSAPPSAATPTVPTPEEAARSVAAREEKADAVEKKADGDYSSDDLGPEATATVPPASTGGSKVLPIVLGAVGVLAVGAGATLVYWGRRDNSQLSTCSTPDSNCAPRDVDHIRKLYILGDIALGVGAAALIGAVVSVAVSNHNHAAETEKEQAVRLDLQPTRSGAVAMVSGSF